MHDNRTEQNKYFIYILYHVLNITQIITLFQGFEYSRLLHTGTSVKRAIFFKLTSVCPSSYLLVQV